MTSSPVITQRAAQRGYVARGPSVAVVNSKQQSRQESIVVESGTIRKKNKCAQRLSSTLAAIFIHDTQTRFEVCSWRDIFMRGLF